MVVPTIGCHERSSHTEWRFTFAKSLENKAAAEGKGDIGGFYVMTFPIPICISMHWNGLNKTNTTTAAKTNHHCASRKVLSIIPGGGHQWGLNKSERSSYTWSINIWQFKSYMAAQTKLQIEEIPLKSCYRAGIIHHSSLSDSQSNDRSKKQIEEVTLKFCFRAGIIVEALRCTNPWLGIEL